jgi:nitrogen regulatory protein P-II 1
MKKIEMYIRPEKLETVKDILNQLEVFGMTVTMVSGCGRQKGRKEFYRGAEFSFNLLPKVKVETVVHDDAVKAVIDNVTTAIRTDKVGDGKIFIYDVADAIKIRTGETGDDAL